MDENTITDLKQFISSTVSQQVTASEDRLSKQIDSVDARLSQKIDSLTNFVTDALDISNEEAGKQLADHEQRITKLEQTTA